MELTRSDGILGRSGHPSFANGHNGVGRRSAAGPMPKKTFAAVAVYERAITAGRKEEMRDRAT